MKKQSLFFLILLAVTLSLAACGGPGAQGGATLVPTPITLEKPTYTVQRGAITETVQLSGRVTPVRQDNLFFLSSGVVNEVLVSVGDFVDAEDVLARLDEPEQYQANVCFLRAGLFAGAAQPRASKVGYADQIGGGQNGARSGR